MVIIGIDPGATIGLCVYDTTAGRVLFACDHTDAIEAYNHVKHLDEAHDAAAIGIERSRIYGIGGNKVADTIEQVGWFVGKLGIQIPPGSNEVLDCGYSVHLIERRLVTGALTKAIGQTVLTDAGVWAALKALHPNADRRPVAGIPGRPAEPPRLRAGSKSKWTIGKPEVAEVPAVEAGPLYGVSSHARSALAVAWALGKHLEG